MRLEAQRLFGRREELAVLRAGLKAASTGAGGVFLVSGPAGVGKTSLARAVAEEAAGQGFQVLWGRCWEAGGAPGYWPWLQILRPLVARGSEAVIEAARPVARYLHGVLPEREVSEPLDSDEARFGLWHAVSLLLCEAGSVERLLVVLEDVHAADVSSLELLRFLTSAPPSGVVLLATFRDAEAGLSPPVIDSLTQAAREAQPVPLGGLDAGATTQLLEATTAGTVAAPILDAVHRLTEGNPFFVEEVARILVAEGRLEDDDPGRALAGVPAGLRQALRRPLSPLSSTETDVLRAAALIGSSFSVAVLRAAVDRPTEEVLSLLEHPLRLGAVRPDGPGRYAFRHALFREVLHADVPEAERARLHRRIGEALEALYADVPDRYAQIAHHFFGAASPSDLERAVDYGRRGARYALSSLAFDEAVTLLERALAAQPGILESREGCELLLDLGEALDAAGRPDDARQVFLEAAESARPLVDPGPLVRAALGFGRGVPGLWGEGRCDPVLVELLQEALDRLGAVDSPETARVLIRLAVELYWDHQASRAEELGVRAVDMVRRVGEPGDVTFVLAGRLSSSFGLVAPEDRLRTATELRGVAEATGDREAAMLARCYKIVALFEIGDRLLADAEVEQFERLAESLGRPHYRWQAVVTRGMTALYEGRFEEASRLTEEALAIGAGSHKAQADVHWGAQFAVRTMLNGSEDEMDAVVATMLVIAGDFPGIQGSLAGCAWTCCYLSALQPDRKEERLQQALGFYEPFAQTAFTNVHRDRNWIATLCVLSETCSWLRDRDRAATLYRLMSPYERYFATLRASVNLGSVARHLAKLAHVCGRLDEADALFARALDAHLATGGRPWASITRREWAALLLERGGPGDGEAAARLVAQAEAGFRELGMEAHLRLTEALRDSAAGSSDQVAVFRRDGDHWIVGFAGRSIRLKDTKGLAYLAELLRRPGREVHAVAVVAAVSADGGASYIDDRRAEVEQLRAEVAEAESWLDQERATRARAALEAVATELAAGQAGALRTERARVSISKAVRTAIARIRPHAPELAAHLAATVRTGVLCSYTPDPRSPITWDMG